MPRIRGSTGDPNGLCCKTLTNSAISGNFDERVTSNLDFAEYAQFCLHA